MCWCGPESESLTDFQGPSHSRPGSHFTWEWGKPDNTLFSPSCFPLSQRGDQVPCLRKCPAGKKEYEGLPHCWWAFQSLRSAARDGWDTGTFPIPSCPFYQLPAVLRWWQEVLSPQGGVQEFRASPCRSSPSILLLQVKKSAKKLQPQNTESMKRPSQKEKKGRPEEKPRSRSALT